VAPESEPSGWKPASASPNAARLEVVPFPVFHLRFFLPDTNLFPATM
jgi:hypothetical protein